MFIHCKIKEYKGFYYWKGMPSQGYSVCVCLS